MTQTSQTASDEVLWKEVQAINNEAEEGNEISESDRMRRTRFPSARLASGLWKSSDNRRTVEAT